VLVEGQVPSAFKSNPMNAVEHILFVLDDSKHPGTAPAWVAIALAVLVILLLLSYVRAFRHFLRRRKMKRFDSVLAYHQKLHEGERW
jgi:hypothetical protein